MSKSIILCTVAVVVLGTVWLTGCGQSSENPAQPTTQTPAANEDAHPGHAQAMTGDYEAALAKLSPVERELAERQKVCPVSDQPLGSMGTPIKVTVKGRDVMLCCKGCEDAIKKDPDKYLAKLAQ